jgi:hypothetical protein
MTWVDQRVLTMLQALTVKGPVTESVLRAQLSGGDQFYPSEIIPMAISRLRASGQVRRTDDGLLEAIVIQPAPAGAAADNTTREIEVGDKAKTCTKCGKDKPLGEFYEGNARCKRCVLDRQKELKAAKEKGVKPAPIAKSAVKPSAKKSNGAAPVQTSQSMVAINFILRIEDVNGVYHDLSVARSTVQRLIGELKEYA